MSAVSDVLPRVRSGPTEPSAAPDSHGARERTHHPLAGFVARRVALMVPTGVLASIMTFLLIHLIPGGPASALMGVDSTSVGIASLNRRLGLDHPLYVQYWRWLTGALHGNLGDSLQDGAPVGHQVLQRLPVSAEMIGLAIVLSVLVAVPAGVWSATRAGRRADGVVRGASGLGLAVPDFFLAILLIDVFAVRIHLLPELGFVPLGQGAGANLEHLVLPMVTLAAGAGAIVVRQVRAAMIDALGSEYLRTARAMGVGEGTIVWRYALRNVLPTILTVYGLLIVGMLGATIILEQVFVLPGLGSALVTAIGARDYPMLQGIVLVYVVIVLVVNLVVDVANSLASPQHRVGTGA